MLIGTVASIRRYPVKSLRGELLDAVEVTTAGVPGDRARRLVVAGEHPRAGLAFRGKEHDRLHLVDTTAEAIVLARERGVETYDESGDHFFDAAPISLLVDRWLDGLSAHVGYAVQPERFRSNFTIAADPTFTLLETELVGAELEIGSVRMRVREPIERCVTTTYHPNGRATDPRILSYIARERDNRMGIYCEVLREGIVQAGDAVACWTSRTISSSASI